MSDKQRLHVDADRGLWIPPAFREFEGQIVFRTPKGTIQHWGSPLDPYYGFIRASSFGDADDLRDPQNPHLAPNRVSIKREGEEAVVFDVDVNDGEKQLIADGGQDQLETGTYTLEGRTRCDLSGINDDEWVVSELDKGAELRDAIETVAADHDETVIIEANATWLLRVVWNDPTDTVWVQRFGYNGGMEAMRDGEVVSE